MLGSFFSSLRSRIMVLVLVAVVPAFVLVFLAGIEHRRLAAERAREEAMRVARLAASQEEQLLDNVRQLFAVLARLRPVHEDDPKSCSALLADFLAVSPFLSNISGVKPTGDVFCSAVPLTRPINVADRDYYRRAVQTDRFIVGEYAIPRLTGQASLFVAQSVPDGAGGIQLVLTAGLAVSWLNALAAQISMPPESSISITDGSGIILARHPGPDQWVGKSISHVPAFQVLRARLEEQTAESLAEDGVARLFALKPLRVAGAAGTGFVSVGIPKAVAFAEADRELRRSLGWLGLAGAITFALAWVTADLMILHQGRRLIEATRRLASGDLSARSGPPYRRGEVGDVARAFDEMAATLQASEAEARRLYAETVRSEARFRDMAEVSGAGIFIRQNERFVYANPAALLISGYSRDELYQLDFWKIAHPDFQDRIRSLRAARERGEAAAPRYELKIVTKSGEERWLDVSVAMTQFEGEPAAMGTVFDITDRKGAEEEQRRYAARLGILHSIDRAILAALAPEATAKAALESLRLVVPTRSAAVALFDLEAGRARWLAVEGAEAASLGPAQDLAREMVGRLDELRAGRVQPIEATALRHHEPARRVLAAGIPSDAVVPMVVEGHLIGSLNIGAAAGVRFTEEHLDIAREVAAALALAIRQARLFEASERRRQEAEELARIARGLTAQQDVSALAQWIIDNVRDLFGARAASIRMLQPDGSLVGLAFAGHDPTIFAAGHAIPAGLGRTAQLIAEGRTMMIPDVLAAMGPDFPDDLRWRLEATGQRALLVVPLRVEGRVIGAFSISDTTVRTFSASEVTLAETLADQTALALERARLYAEVTRHAAELEERVAERTAQLGEANSELEAFAYSVAHDLRAPLRAMQGFSQALIEDYGDRLDAAGRDYAERISGAASDMDLLIHDLLAYSRLSREELKIEPVGLEPAVTEAQAQIGATLRERGGRISVEAPLPEVMGHRGTLVQVTANLLGNAIKFVAPDVEPSVRVWTEPREGCIRLWVKDNGIGIAPEHQERIFRVFERLHGRETYPGTGIGLAIVHRGVERMGGRVGVESAPGRGSRFWVELPTPEAQT
jgi:PAS domain S-box-containing protein